eukprot:Gb_05277 [translate_table: standard]
MKRNLTEMNSEIHCTGQNFHQNDYENRLWMEIDVEKQLEFYNSDPNDDQTDVEQKQSRNLYSERKRRQKLNETLYKLRAAVPKISKMNKQSIVRDAISYVLELQKEVKEIESDIVAGISCGEHHVDRSDEIAEKKRLSSENNTVSKNESTKSEEIFCQGGNELRDAKILELQISRVDEKIYHMRVYCKKDVGVLVQLARALEFLQLELITSNIYSVDDHILYSITANVNALGSIEEDSLKDVILETVSKYGLYMVRAKGCLD